MTDAHLNAEQPAWAFSWEHRVDGTTVFRSEDGEPLVALAVTRAELRQLQSGLQLLPQNEATLALLHRLAVLHEDLDAVAE